ncbi:MAG: 16S rRNA (guanine(966)-N(2))-methyltransferase RsmD [Bacteroidales bacterium]|nr:16S rRNA (guanine(966)-N(2))-methyltransferase RsmD [Bacteroidales bacterium]
MRIIRGKYGRRRFDVPKNISARPTTDFARENLFNVLNNVMDFEEISALDLFAGTGAISFELLSRGASKVVSVEKHSTQYDFINKVARELKDENIITIKGDVFKFISSSKEKFDFIFADPPYDLPNLSQIPELIFKAGLLKRDGIFVLEHSRKNDFSDMPEFDELRTYGSVNFSFFSLKEDEQSNE